jgi:hypothetical protein
MKRGGSRTISVPDLADDYELEALRRADRNSSLQDVIRTVRQSGVLEVEDLEEDPVDGIVDRGSEHAERLSYDLAREVEARLRACGAPRPDGSSEAYPFRVEADYIEVARRRPFTEPYTFMLLLSLFGGRAGPLGINAERLFEAVSSHAGHRYFGAPQDGVTLVRFGFPRKNKSSFITALNQLAAELGEGGKAIAGQRAKQRKDDAVDVVVYRNFPDGGPGKLIAFGQCASGKHWINKRTELKPDAFCKNWLTKALVTDPLLRLMFIPRRIDSDAWDEHSRYAGIIFDRCRIAALCTDLDAETRRLCTEWSAHVLDVKVRVA